MTPLLDSVTVIVMQQARCPGVCDSVSVPSSPHTLVLRVEHGPWMQPDPVLGWVFDPPLPTDTLVTMGRLRTAEEIDTELADCAERLHHLRTARAAIG